MINVSSIELHDVGPREGFQFEGIKDPNKISTENKVRLVEALSETGVKRIQVTSFVSPKWVPQMADAEEVSRRLKPKPGVTYDSIYLNDKGLERCRAAGKYELRGNIGLTASETFSKKNQNRTIEQDIEMKRTYLKMYADYGIPVDSATIMAAFGCNYEGDIPRSRVVEQIRILKDLAAEYGQKIEDLLLADTMGWGDPESIKRMIDEVKSAFPDIEIALHLHDTRGTGLANIYAALEMGIRKFDSSVAGLGGCPFAGVVAGNVCTEDIVFMCDRMGIETGIDLKKLCEVAMLAEEIVSHPLPTKIAHVLK